MSTGPDGDPVGAIVENGYIDGMVTGWTLLVTYLDPDGTQQIRTDTMENQAATTTLGHGQAIVAVGSAHIVRAFDEED